MLLPYNNNNNNNYYYYDYYDYYDYYCHYYYYYYNSWIQATGTRIKNQPRSKSLITY